jgi:predicted ABC-type ATPase
MTYKKLYVIAGCNGAGKTTASFTILPEILDCKEFINADEIARGISPFQPDKVSFEAGRIMLNRINELLYRSENPEVIERRYIRGIKNLSTQKGNTNF